MRLSKSSIWDNTVTLIQIFTGLVIIRAVFLMAGAGGYIPLVDDAFYKLMSIFGSDSPREAFRLRMFQ